MTTNAEKQQNLRVPVGALKRPQYEAGNYLASKDLLDWQRYLIQRLRRHNRYLHGWGVVCGLRVVPAKDPRRPWAVLVCPGYAIGTRNDEIEVSVPATVDVRDYMWRRPHDHGQPAPVAYVGIRYAEEEVRPIPANPPACDCDDTIWKPSRIRNGFQVDVLWALSKTGDAEGFDLCEQGLAPCPDCPDSPYLILARLRLPASENDPITGDRIDNSVRRQLHSTAMLQEQLIACCCKGRPPLPPIPVLQIEKDILDKRRTQLGPEITYGITLTNASSSGADNVILKDLLKVSGIGAIHNAFGFSATHGSWTETDIASSPFTKTAQFEAKITELPPGEVAKLKFSVGIRGEELTILNTATVPSHTTVPESSATETKFPFEA